MMAPARVNVPVQQYKNTLTVTIRDRSAHGADVFQASAVNVSETDDLTAVLPYLARAIFEDFPGNNGQVREVKYDIDSEERARVD